VRNTNENVQIRLTGEPEQLQRFLVALSAEAPPASRVEQVETEQVAPEVFTAFTILSSDNVSLEVTEISPDIAVCSDCMEDIRQPGTRSNYGFVNCTNCGPRFTIIRDLPYDRAKTTMQAFPMCGKCREEYNDVNDRRFHAQPTACSMCGPAYELVCGEEVLSTGMEDILQRTAAAIARGAVVLMKGLGGMHLACDAFNEAATGKLRDLKNRDGKPFAVMFRDLEAVRETAWVSAEEAQSLASWRRPIVLLQLKKMEKDGTGLATNICSGLSMVGAMLPYLPLHYLLFEKMKTPAIVLTSGNVSSEPILTGNMEALASFSGKVDLMVLHNRDIYNRTDDSVVRVMAGTERVFRRSRGYAPAAVSLALDTEGILAFGAELTNTFCAGKGHKAFMSQYIGDLQGYETARFYEETIAKYLRLFRVTPSLLAVDLHPDYISTRTAGLFGDLPVVRVQHHHAHIASCMAEHRLDEQVIGVAFDGTGLGDDGHIWGSEFFICGLGGYERIAHFGYLPLPGGDMAAEEPWRMAVSWLYQVYGEDFRRLKVPVLAAIEPVQVDNLVRMIDRKINSPLTCGAGRFFDAVASLTGVCHVASFQAEGPMRLESLAQGHCTEVYPFESGSCIRLDQTLRGIVDDLACGIDAAIIAKKFHNTLISVIFETVIKIRRDSAISKVVLSGGVFQNKHLLEGAISLLREHQFDVYSHKQVPSNDGGIALGQLAVASKRRSLKCV
jgi:hydrogenase maturation protein HypF